MATNYAKENGLNVQNHADQVGLMPYQYEYDKSLKNLQYNNRFGNGGKR